LGDVVIMDNLRAHKVAGAGEAIEAAGASLLFIPALQSGSESNRAGFRQTEGAVMRFGKPRRLHRLLHPARRRQLFPAAMMVISTQPETAVMFVFNRFGRKISPAGV
jgi:hypothetical protein